MMYALWQRGGGIRWLRTFELQGSGGEDSAARFLQAKQPRLEKSPLRLYSGKFKEPFQQLLQKDNYTTYNIQILE